MSKEPGSLEDTEVRTRKANWEQGASGQSPESGSHPRVILVIISKTPAWQCYSYEFIASNSGYSSNVGCSCAVRCGVYENTYVNKRKWCIQILNSAGYTCAI